ncbi:hypothetical protein L210DRAFT_2995164 [Boletus edulis BED1]|uniref:Uncharacterized protein n=1 Tax=Boletus edulis BED1 TaxID=1328754 RepID=A0AAD4BI25_BOLED|nr:hypothetical protein L210DRAFT_3025118 [Boletus edulis BED1]KAF8431175.1 hypothetical protein L210DRAFT_2995164 [Boletus edulis BED1]
MEVAFVPLNLSCTGWARLVKQSALSCRLISLVRTNFGRRCSRQRRHNRRRIIVEVDDTHAPRPRVFMRTCGVLCPENKLELTSIHANPRGHTAHVSRWAGWGMHREADVRDHDHQRHLAIHWLFVSCNRSFLLRRGHARMPGPLVSNRRTRQTADPPSWSPPTSICCATLMTEGSTGRCVTINNTSCITSCLIPYKRQLLCLRHQFVRPEEARRCNSEILLDVVSV